MEWLTHSRPNYTAQQLFNAAGVSPEQVLADIATAETELVLNPTGIESLEDVRPQGQSDEMTVTFDKS